MRNLPSSKLTPRARPLPEREQHVASHDRLRRLLDAAPLLDPADADLLAAYYARGEHRGSIASRLGCAPHTVSRRALNLVRRIESRSFHTLAQALPLLPALERELATRLLFRRETLHRVAYELSLPYHEVRTRARTLRLWHQLMLSNPVAGAALASAMHGALRLARARGLSRS